MYLKYFDKFYDQDGYLDISEEEWTYIKETFEKDDVKESLAKVAMTYPIPYAEISEEVCLKDYKKLCLSISFWQSEQGKLKAPIQVNMES